MAVMCWKYVKIMTDAWSCNVPRVLPLKPADRPTLPPGYAPEKIEYGVNRYQNETRRLYRVMDTHLAKSTSGYLVGDKCTIADMSCWGWVAAHREFPPIAPSSSIAPRPLPQHQDGMLINDAAKQIGPASTSPTSRT